jgi:capsular exopolysaccharide synthesis family protein
LANADDLVFPDVGESSIADAGLSDIQDHRVGDTPVARQSVPEIPKFASTDLDETTTAPVFWEFQDNHFRESPWAAPDCNSLLFVQEESVHQLEREQFRTLRSRLYQVRTNRPIRTILVSSAMPAEGKTFVSANLAMAIVRQHGRSVLLVDADLRKSALHKLLGAPATPGLTEYLAGEADAVSVIQKAPIPNLCFLPAGRPVANSGELVGNGRLAKLIERVAPLFDWIIIDSPPAVPISDTSLIAEAVDGIVLVVKASSTPFDIARKACLEFRRKPILGVVLNHVGRSAMYGAYYDQYYGKQKATSEQKS